MSLISLCEPLPFLTFNREEEFWQCSTDILNFGFSIELSSNPDSTSHQLCDFGKVTECSELHDLHMKKKVNNSNAYFIVFWRLKERVHISTVLST